MKRILFAMLACMTSTGAMAGDWTASTQDVKDGVWGQWMHSSYADDEYMDYVASDCNAAMIIQPYAVKIRFADGTEKLFLCDDIRAKKKEQ